MSTELPPALAERRAELNRAIDADNEAAEHLRDKIAEVLRNRDAAASELRGINAAIEAFGSVALPVEPSNGAEKPARRPRRDIRAMVKQEMALQFGPAEFSGEYFTPAAIATRLGCRVAQVEAALRLIPLAPNGGEE